MNSKVSTLTQTYLQSILHYEAISGSWTWKQRYDVRQWWNTRFAGTPAGATDSHGHIQIKICGRPYLSRRLAVFYVTGKWPDGHLDHKDTDKGNGKFLNLRPATREQNGANRGKNSNNTSGLKGVTWNKKQKKWHAQISSRFLLSSDCLAAAHFSYLIAADKAYGEFARGG